MAAKKASKSALKKRKNVSGAEAQRLSFLGVDDVSAHRPFDAPVQEHTQRVQAMKSWISLILAVLVIGFVVWPFVGSEDHTVKLGIAEEVTTEEISPHMKRPRLHGVDQKGQPYTITAEEAVQRSMQVVGLKGLNADITLSEESWISLASNYGVYDMEKRQLDLNEKIMIFTDKGYEMQTSQAVVDLMEQEAVGEKEINVYGPLGTLRADAFVIRNSGDVFEFEGGVHVVTYP